MAIIRLEGTQTAENLAKAFAIEAQARNRYYFYSKIARGQGYPTLEEAFLETADNELGHSEAFFIYMTEGLDGQTLYPQVPVITAQGTTSENLYYAAMAEFEEYSNYYPLFGQVAQSEGFDSIAQSFFSVAEIERRHFLRFQDLLDRYETDMLFRSEEPVVWECLICGYRVESTEPPRICPACLHKREYFKITCASVL